MRDLNLPDRSRLISVSRGGRAEIAVGDTALEPGDLVMAILEPGVEDELKRVLMPALDADVAMPGLIERYRDRLPVAATHARGRRWARARRRSCPRRGSPS